MRGLFGALLAVLLLSGCQTIASTFSGNSSQELAETSDGEIAVNPITRQPVKLNKKQTQAAAVSEDTRDVLKKVADVEIKRLELRIIEEKNKGGPTVCDTLTFAQANELKAAAQDRYYAGVERCREREFFSGIITTQNQIIARLTQGKSDLVGVAEHMGATIRSVASEGTKKLHAFMNPLADTLKVKFGFDYASDASADRASVAVAGVENSGDTTVGDISIGGGLSNGAQSNDGGNGGPGGEFTAGGPGGNGDGTSTNTSNGGTTIINIGDENNTGISSDNGRSFAGTRSTQQVDPSGTGMLIEDSNVDQPNAIDENNGDLSNQPANGGNSLLDL